MKTVVALKARTSRLLAVAALGLTAGFGLPGCGDPPILYLDSPTHGQFLLGTTVNVSGHASSPARAAATSPTMATSWTCS